MHSAGIEISGACFSHPVFKLPILPEVHAAVRNKLKLIRDSQVSSTLESTQVSPIAFGKQLAYLPWRIRDKVIADIPT